MVHIFSNKLQNLRQADRNAIELLLCMLPTVGNPGYEIFHYLLDGTVFARSPAEVRARIKVLREGGVNGPLFLHKINADVSDLVPLGFSSDSSAG